jgi:hypothetical protein
MKKTLTIAVILFMALTLTSTSNAQLADYFQDYKLVGYRVLVSIDSADVATRQQTNDPNEIYNIIGFNLSLSDSICVYMYQDSTGGGVTTGDSIKSKVYVEYYADLGPTYTEKIYVDSLSLDWGSQQIWSVFTFIPKKCTRFNIVYEPRYGTDSGEEELEASETILFKTYVYAKKSEAAIRKQTR